MHNKKPWYRPRNVVLVTLLLLVLLLGYKAMNLVTAKPVISVNYSQKIVELVESNQSADAAAPNAWPIYVHAVETTDAIGREIRAQAPALGDGTVVPDYTLIFTPDAPPYQPEPGTDPGLAAAEAQEAAEKAARAATAREWTLKCLLLLKERGVYDELRQLTTATRFVRPKAGDESLALVQLPDVGMGRSLARTMGARMHIAGQAGDDGELVAAFEQGLALGRVVGHQGTLIERLVSMATTSMMLGRVRAESMQRSLDAKTCRELLAAMDRQCVLPPMSMPMKTERFFFLDTVQRTHSDDGHGSGYRLLRESDALQVEWGMRQGGVRPAIVNLGGVLYPSRAALVAEGEKIYAGIATLADTPRLRRGAGSPDLDVERLPRGYDMLRLLVPALGKALQSNDQSVQGLAGTRTMLAIEAFRAEQGRLPASLDELAPTILARLPVDPFAPDGRFHYRVLSSPDESGRTYLLYSVGADGVDDGGVMDARDNLNALLNTGRGKDFIVNAPAR